MSPEWEVVAVVAAGVLGIIAWSVRRVFAKAERRLDPAWGTFAGAVAAQVRTPGGPAIVVPQQVPGVAGIPESTSVVGERRDSTVRVSPEPAMMAGLAGAAGLYEWYHPDGEVLEAFTRYRGEDVDNGLELWRSIAGDSGAKSLDVSDVAVLRGLRGHLGEQVAADHLTAAGHTAVFPQSGSNPGWDIDVDGELLVNSKIVGDAPGALADHFGTYPDVPVLINADAGGLPETALLWDGQSAIDVAELSAPGAVLVDQSLTSDALEDQLADAIPAIDPWGSLTDAGDMLPSAGAIIAVAMSAKREAGLVRSGDTTGARAAKNVAIDGGSRAVGFFAGAKAGGFGGAAIDAASGGTTLGLGFVVGGILGGIAGAMAAKKGAQHLRTAPLRDAAGALGLEAEEYSVARDRAHAEAQARVDLERERARLLVGARLLLSRRTLAARAGAAVSAIRDAQRVDSRRVLDEAYAELRRLATSADESTFGGKHAPRWLRRLAAHRAVSRWRARYHLGVLETPEPGIVSADLWDIVSVSPAGRRAMSDHLSTVAERRRAEAAACAAAVQTEFESLVRCHAACASHVSGARRTEVAHATEKLAPLWGRVEAAREVYTRELRAAGLGELA